MEELGVSGAILAIVLVVGLLYLIFVVYTIYHLVTKRGPVNVIIWLIVIITIPLIGCIIYWVMYRTSSPGNYDRNL